MKQVTIQILMIGIAQQHLILTDHQHFGYQYKLEQQNIAEYWEH